MTNEELQEQLAGAQYAAAQHLKTVQQQAKIISGMDPRPIPASHRLLPVALHPAIEEALKRYTWMPESAWQDVIAAWDRVKPALPEQGDDLAKLRKLAEAATPGMWEAKPHGRIIGGPLRHYVNGSAQAQIAACSVTFHDQAPDDEPERQQANTEFIAAFSPAVVLRLLDALAATERSGKTADEVVWRYEYLNGGDEWTTCYSEDEPEPRWDRRNFVKFTHPAASSSAAPSVPKWSASVTPWSSKDETIDAMEAEIAALRAALATPSVQAVAAGQEQIFTYAGVTQNIEASRFGEAARRTMQKPGGDSIDTGLQLLLELQNMGYGIVAVPGLSRKPPALAGDTKAGE